ncbi:MAG TPA: hypothetical protein VF021_05280 [Longimicrobiales bacterium]
MNLVLAIACDKAEVAPDGKLNVEGIYNELSAPDFPAAHPALTVVLVIEWDMHDAGEQPIRADLVDPQGEMVVTIQGHTDVELAPDNEVPPQTRIVLPLENVIFQTPGRYHLRVQAGASSVEAMPLYVRRMRA